MVDYRKIEGACKVDKNWGYEQILVNKGLYCGKILHINAFRRMTVHYHEVKDETFHNLGESVELTYYEDPKIDQYLLSWVDLEEAIKNKKYDIKRDILRPGDSFYIPVGLRHSLRAFKSAVKVIEISTTDDPNDSYRIIQSD